MQYDIELFCTVNDAESPEDAKRQVRAWIDRNARSFDPMAVYVDIADDEPVLVK